MINDTYIRNAKVTRVIDGDTFVCNVDLGFKIAITDVKVRVLRINAPELHGESAEQGKLSLDFVLDSINTKDIVIQTTKKDSFGRWLAEVWYINEEGEQVNLADVMLRLNFAVPFNG